MKLIDIVVAGAFIVVMCLILGWILTRPRERPSGGRISMYEQRASTPEGTAALAKAREELEQTRRLLGEDKHDPRTRRER